MFRTQARATEPNQDLDRPFRVVTIPALLGLGLAVVAAIAGMLWLFGGQISVRATAIGMVVNPPGNATVTAPVSGVITGALSPVGMRVTSGDVVAYVRAADGSLESVHAPLTGTIVSISTGIHASIGAGAPILTIAPATNTLAAVMFVPARAIADVVPGIPAEVEPSTVDVHRYGFLLGEVAEVSPLPLTVERLQLILGNDGLLQEVLAEGPVHEVVIEFKSDPQGALGLAWSGPGIPTGDRIVSGTVASARIVLREQTPWQAFIGADTGSPIPDPGVNDVLPIPVPQEAQQLPLSGALSIGGKTIKLEVAKTQREREIGLMFRRELPADQGMAFVFERPTPASLWTKNLLIPIDMIFVKNNTVTNVEANLEPCEADPCPASVSADRVTTVIQLAAGRAAELGIRTGSQLTLDLA